MYAYTCNTGSGFFALVWAAGHGPLFSCDPPPLQLANGSMPAPYPIILTAANLYSLLQHIGA
jgi:hypothetical protein